MYFVIIIHTHVHIILYTTQLWRIVPPNSLPPLQNDEPGSPLPRTPIPYIHSFPPSHPAIGPRSFSLSPFRSFARDTSKKGYTVVRSTLLRTYLTPRLALHHGRSRSVLGKADQRSLMHAACVCSLSLVGGKRPFGRVIAWLEKLVVGDMRQGWVWGGKEGRAGQ
jgi:hypothetical protein